MRKLITSGLLFLVCFFVMGVSAYSSGKGDVIVGGFADDDILAGITQTKPYGEMQNPEKMCSPPETAKITTLQSGITKASRNNQGAVSAGERGIEVAYATELASY
jgi:hypothetical protein